MTILVILLAIVWIIMGVLFVILTDASKQIIANLVKQKNVNFLSLLSIIIGIVLILGSPSANMPWVIAILGMLAICKGLFFMLGPKKKTRAFIDSWLNAPVKIHRIWGIAAFLFGVMLLLIL